MTVRNRNVRIRNDKIHPSVSKEWTKISQPIIKLTSTSNRGSTITSTSAATAAATAKKLVWEERRRELILLNRIMILVEERENSCRSV